MLFIGYGLFGVPYFAVIAAIYVTLLAVWRAFTFKSVDLVALALPIALYLFLNDVVEDRQEFYAGYANLVIAGVVAAALPIRRRDARRPLLNPIIVTTGGLIAAALSWRLMPPSPPWPMF